MLYSEFLNQFIGDSTSEEINKSLKLSELTKKITNQRGFLSTSQN